MKEFNKEETARVVGIAVIILTLLLVSGYFPIFGVGFLVGLALMKLGLKNPGLVVGTATIFLLSVLAVIVANLFAAFTRDRRR